MSLSPIKTVPNSVGELFNLKYLGLDNTKVKELPKSIARLHNLETLSLQDAECLALLQGSEKLKKLQYILIWKGLHGTGEKFRNYESIEPFEGLWNLKELQTLYSVRASKVFVAKIRNLSQLRTIIITEVRSSHCAQLCDSLSKMLQLSNLNIRAINEDEVLQLETLTLPNPLQKLCLEGRLSEGTLKSPFFSTHGQALLKLNLFWSQSTQNLVTGLSILSKLTYLHLTRAYIGHEINIQVGWFPDLKVMYLLDLPHVNQIGIDEGALVRLEDLWIHGLVELRVVPTGLEYLKSLKEATFTCMHPDFVKNIRTAKLDHIPKVYY